MFRIQRTAEWDFSVWRFPALKRLLPNFLEYWSQCQYQKSTAKFGQKSQKSFNDSSPPKRIYVCLFCQSHTRPLFVQIFGTVV